MVAEIRYFHFEKFLKLKLMVQLIIHLKIDLTSIAGSKIGCIIQGALWSEGS